MGLFSRKKTEPEPEAAVEAAAPEEAADTTNGELIAVISAAIAAYEAESFVQTLYIQKINRNAGALPAWGAMGRQEAIDTRRM